MNVSISVRQYINGEWVSIGFIRGYSMTKARNIIDEFEEKLVLNSSEVGTVTFRQNVNSLMVVNLNHGPVSLKIIECTMEMEYSANGV
jgi:hypothetical protein